MLLPRLKEFVDDSCQKDSDREVLTMTEIKDLLTKHFPGLVFSTIEPGGPYCRTVATCDPRTLMKVAVQRFYPREDVELRISSSKLLIRYLPLRKLEMECWGHGWDSMPEPFCTQRRSFISAVKSKAGPEVEIILPEPVKVLQIPDLEHTSVGFEKEIEALSKKISLANHPQKMACIEIGTA